MVVPAKFIRFEASNPHFSHMYYIVFSTMSRKTNINSQDLKVRCCSCVKSWGESKGHILPLFLLSLIHTSSPLYRSCVTSEFQHCCCLTHLALCIRALLLYLTHLHTWLCVSEDCLWL